MGRGSSGPTTGAIEGFCSGWVAKQPDYRNRTHFATEGTPFASSTNSM